MNRRFVKTTATAVLILALGCMTRSGVKHPQKVTGPLALYVEGKSLDEAGAALDKALEKKPADPLLHYLTGDIRYLQGDFDGATESFLSAVRHASGSGGSHLARL